MVNEEQAAELALRRGELLVAMADSITELAKQTGKLREDMGKWEDRHAEERQQHSRERSWQIFVGTALLVLLVILVIGQFTSRRVLHLISDAVTPSGKIYQRGQAGQAAAIAAIDQRNQAVISAAASCTVSLPPPVTYQAVKDCVTRDLASVSTTTTTTGTP